MTERVLFVDDEPRVLDGVRRLLRTNFEIEVAEGGRAGLEALEHNEFAVIVSDMMMPEIDGPAFLAKAAEIQPDAVQMILSGQADLSSTIAAVNGGNVFRFLMKPTDREDLIRAVEAAKQLFRLRRVEQELLQQTLSAAVAALGEVLSMASPQATRRAGMVRHYVEAITGTSELASDWQLNVAVTLSNIGCVAIPQEVLSRSDAGADLTRAEQQMLDRHPEVASELIARIPRLGGVAEIVRAQRGASTATVRDELTQHAGVLQLATDVADRVLRGLPEEQAVALAQQTGRYPAELFTGLHQAPEPRQLAEVKSDQLHHGMVLINNLCTPSGAVIANADTTLSATMIERIHNFASGVGVVEPIAVALPPKRLLQAPAN